VSKKTFILQLAGICAGVNRAVQSAAPASQPGVAAAGLERVAGAAAAAGAPPENRAELNRFVVQLLGAATSLRAEQAANDAGNVTAASALKTQADAEVTAANQAGQSYGMPDLRRCEEYVANEGNRTAPPSGGADDQDASAAASPSVVQAYATSPRVTSTLKIGGPVGGIALSSDGRALYVASIATKQILVVDVATMTITSQIDVPARPRTVTVSPDGSRLYVVLFGDAGDPVTGKPKGAAVMWVDVLTRHASRVTTLGTDVYGVTVAPDGSRIYCADHDSAKVSVWDVATDKVTTVPVAPNPHGVVVTRDGGKAYAADHESNVVQLIDTKTLTAGAKIPVGRSPHSVALSPDGRTLFVTNYDSNTVSVIDTTADVVTGSPIGVGTHPQATAFTPDGARALVVNNADNSVSVIVTRTRQVVATVPVGVSPTSVVVSRDGALAFVGNLRSSTVSVIRLIS
jgi:YVTN family beta-propeller protein